MDVTTNAQEPPSRPRISVIIPVYNGERYLAETIQSILAQTLLPLEIIVVDDGSTDGTAAIAQSFPTLVRYVYQPNQGVAYSLNRGIQLAQGDFLAFLDSDDLWLPEKLARQMAVLEADSRLEAVFTYIRQFYSPDVEQKIRLTHRYTHEVLPGYHSDTLLIRAEAFQRIGPFDTSVPLVTFMSWFAHAQDLGLRYTTMPDILVLRRIHDRNMTIYQKQKSRSEYFQMLKANITRRRAAR